MTAQSMLMVLAFTGITPTEMTVSQATEILKPKVQTGTLLFSQGDCLAVKIFTRSPYTHVAAVVVDKKNNAVVYESMNGVGVRKMAFKKYMELQKDSALFVVQPNRPLHPEFQRQFHKHLESELGRPYGIKHHLTGNRAEGVHCSEYVTDALKTIQWIEAEKPPRVSPASLYNGLIEHEIYTQDDIIRIVSLKSTTPEPDTWRGKLWKETIDCTNATCKRLTGWFMCK